NGVFGSHEYTGVKKITEKTLIKSYSGAHVHAVAHLVNLVALQTDIPIPRVQEVVTTPNGGGVIVMDFIKGAKQLGEVWKNMSWWQKLKVALTLREYLDALRKIQYPHSDRVGNPFIVPRFRMRLEGLQFGDYDVPPPRSTKRRLATFIRSYSRSCRRTVRRLPRYLFDTLVVTHNDLNMRNILVDENGTLWIIDWDWAGFFPPWFEYYAARTAAKKDKEDED
ncbi:hypothetical protein H0H93_001842, partial [Arthromyces matolae]